MTTPTTPHSPKSHEDAMGDDHVGTSSHTPLKPDAFALSDEEKIAKIETKFREIMDVMGLDLNDDSLSGTPKRVAKMYVKEIFSGLNPANHPDVKTFDNVYGYNHMLVERDINVNSTCEHHFLPIVGHAHVAYIPNGRVVGLSKLNRIVDHYARRPQVQERLTRQVLQSLQELLSTDDVAVVIDAKHLCVSSRGIQDESSSTVTASYGGLFDNDVDTRNEFLAHVGA
ncbi:MAG: GTP cyclohydrolase I FolE [Crocinitomicaceae bacterium]|nr:GTP cyclohydrolase I FolE [Crocinitomicaceae bacterium]